MTEKQLNETIERLGGSVEYPYEIKLPKKLRIKTKIEALDVLDILLNCDDIGGTANEAGDTYQINDETAYKALKVFIKKEIP